MQSDLTPGGTVSSPVPAAAAALASAGADQRGRATARLLGEVATIAEHLCDNDAAARAHSAAAVVSSGAAQVVVVGEKKRGKSSLINALLRRPDLLPVDSDIATSVHVSVYAADEDQACVTMDGAADESAIAFDQIAEYAALDPHSMEMMHPNVRSVRVGIQDPLLEQGIVLVDTPGVGGLVSGHAALTLSALSLADALLFVVNGSSELTASECTFLGRATERVSAVVFVLAQTDKYPKWRDVVARNQQLIAEHAPRFADARWFPVSSRLRLDSVRLAAAGDLRRAHDLDERSGFRQLERALIEQIAGRTADLRAANATWVAVGVLDRLTAAQEQRLASLERDPGLVAAVTSQRAKLNECRRADAQWRRTLSLEFSKLSRQMNLLYNRSITELQLTAEEWTAEADTATATQVAHDFEAGVLAMWADIESGSREGALRIAAEIAAELDTQQIDALSIDVPNPEQLTLLPGMTLTEEAKEKGASALLAKYWPSMSGFSMTSMAGHLLFAAVNPIALIGVGAVVAATLFSKNKARADIARARADVQRYVQSVLARARVEIPNAMHEALESLHSELETAINERMTARDREMESAIAEASRHLEASEQELLPQRSATQLSLRQLAGLTARAEQLADSLGLRIRADGLGIGGPR
jgi:predicted GTPase